MSAIPDITWQLSMGRADLPYIIQVSKNFPNGLLNYEKGSANMVLMPKLGDQVLVTCQAKLRCIGHICREVHLAYNPYVNQYDSYLTIMVDEIIADPPYMKGRRRNWTRL